jgi:hypothetical protein
MTFCDTGAPAAASPAPAFRLDAPPATRAPRAHGAVAPVQVTPERIRDGLRIAAALATRNGAGFLPEFERLEAEAARLAAPQSALARAARLAGGLE